MTLAAVVVDTDVISFLLKDDTRVQAYRPHLQDKTLVLSFMTVAELYQWAYQPAGARNVWHGWKIACMLL